MVKNRRFIDNRRWDQPDPFQGSPTTLFHWYSGLDGRLPSRAPLPVPRHPCLARYMARAYPVPSLFFCTFHSIPAPSLLIAPQGREKVPQRQGCLAVVAVEPCAGAGATVGTVDVGRISRSPCWMLTETAAAPATLGSSHFPCSVSLPFPPLFSSRRRCTQMQGLHQSPGSSSPAHQLPVFFLSFLQPPERDPS